MIPTRTQANAIGPTRRRKAPWEHLDQSFPRAIPPSGAYDVQLAKAASRHALGVTNEAQALLTDAHVEQKRARLGSPILWRHCAKLLPQAIERADRPG